MENKCEICVENVTKAFGSQEVLKTVCVKFELGKDMEVWEEMVPEKRFCSNVSAACCIPRQGQ